MALKDVFTEKRDIVVCIPNSRLADVEAEEADVERRLKEGETDIGYYWQMGRLPKDPIRRIYFSWGRGVQAYHLVTRVDREAGRIYMDPEIHEVPLDPMPSFRGFRYYQEK